MQLGSETPITLAPSAVASTAAGLRAWIASGACQSESGAFVAWVDFATGRLSYDYPEITGYALTFLASQASLSEDECSVGHRAAAWLVDRVRRGKLAARDGWDDDAVYLFDLAMVASGLLSFGRRVQVERYVEAGLELVSFLVDELASTESISPVSARGRPSGRRSWSTHGRPHLAKLVQAFLLSGQSAEIERLNRLIESVKSLQCADGRMLSHLDELTTMLHPHLYAAEGLWIWGSATGEADSLERARAAVEWACTHQLEEGGFPRSVADGVRSDDAIEQSDVTAQIVRLALVFGLGSRVVERSIARLKELACESEGMLGMVYQPASPNIHLNTGATLFAAQALAMAVTGAPVVIWSEFV